MPRNELSRDSSTAKAVEILKARSIYRRALSDDGTMIAYVSNVAMLLHDRYGITDYETRNKAAMDILLLLFSEGGHANPAMAPGGWTELEKLFPPVE